MNAQCINTDGSYNCSCSSGYSGDGMTCTGKIQITISVVTTHLVLHYSLQILTSVVVIVTTVIFKQHVQTLMVATTVRVSLDTQEMEPLAMVL